MTCGISNRLIVSALAAALVAVFPAQPARAQDPDFSDVDDILDGQRVLADVVDLVAVDPAPTSSSATNPTEMILTTDQGRVTGQTTVAAGEVPCHAGGAQNKPFPQQVRGARLFDRKNDMLFRVLPTANASGVDCKGTLNMAFSVEDRLDAANDSTATRSLSAQFVQLAVADFDFDGFDDVLFINDEEAFVVSAADVSDPTLGLTFGPSVSTGASRSPFSEPTVGDLNADGNLDIAWTGAQYASGGIRPIFVHVATVCPGSVPNTVCDGAGRFEIILNPLSFQPIELPVTQSGSCFQVTGTAATVGNFLPDISDELVTIDVEGSSCVARIRLYDFDGTLQPTMLDLQQADQGSVGTVSVYANTAHFDWFGDTDQAVAWIAPDQFAYIITFKANGTMVVRRNPISVDGGQSLRGVVTGVFGPPAGGFQDASDFAPQIATLSVTNATFDPQAPTLVSIYDVDPNDDFSLRLSSQFEAAQYVPPLNTTFNLGGNYIQPADLLGRSVRVGEPDVIRVTQSSQPQIVLGVPPMHVDYVRLDRDSPDDPEVVNFSVIPSTYRSYYETMVSGEAQSLNKSTTSYTTAVKKTKSEGAKVGYKSVVSVGESMQQVLAQTHEQSVSKAYNTYIGADVDASTATGFGDQIWFTVQRFNIYAYPVIGQRACPADDPECTNPDPLYILFSGADQTIRDSINGTTVEWYHPIHEPGQVLSYPWSREQIEQRFGSVDVLSNEAAFFTDTSQRTVRVNWSGGQGMDVTSGTVDTFSQSTSTSVSGGVETAIVGGGVSSSVDMSESEAFATLNSSSLQLGASTGIGVDKTDSFRQPSAYQYLVQPYIFGQAPPQGTEQTVDTDSDISTTGILTTSFVADPTDSLAGAWWGAGPYVDHVDVALNHPIRWTLSGGQPLLTKGLPASCLSFSLNGVDSICLENIDPDPSDPWTNEFYWMRGLLVTVGGAAGPQALHAVEGDDVFLQARVYNYSLRQMDPDTEPHIRFYRQRWNQTTNRAIGDSVLISEEVVDPIPPFNQVTNTTLPNWRTVTTSFNTQGMGNAYWTFWVVVWLQDASGNLVAELPGHGLDSLPGTLAAIGDVPIEQVTVTGLDGRPKTTSFSNNVGFLNSTFYVIPAAGEGSGAALVREGGDAGLITRPRIQLANLSVSPDRVEAGGRVIVAADVHAPDIRQDGVPVLFYDGDPDDGGKTFDMELLSAVRRGGSHQVRVPYHPQECGMRTLLLVANPGQLTEVRASANLEVVCPEPPSGAAGGGDDDGCQVSAGTAGTGLWLLLAPVLALLALGRRRTAPRG